MYSTAVRYGRTQTWPGLLLFVFQLFNELSQSLSGIRVHKDFFLLYHCHQISSGRDLIRAFLWITLERTRWRRMRLGSLALFSCARRRCLLSVSSVAAAACNSCVCFRLAWSGVYLQGLGQKCPSADETGLQRLVVEIIKSLEQRQNTQKNRLSNKKQTSTYVQ